MSFAAGDPRVGPGPSPVKDGVATNGKSVLRKADVRGATSPQFLKANYDWAKDAFGCYEYWREWKGMQLVRAQIIRALLKRVAP